MYPIIGCNFIDRPLPPERFQDHLGFELPTVPLPLYGHRFPCSLKALTHLPYSVVHFLGYIILFDRCDLPCEDPHVTLGPR